MITQKPEPAPQRTLLRIRPQIDPGVPATLSLGEPRVALALKSGNFGAPDFFLKALEALR